jgi:PAS domain S-box-containing protein
MTPTTTTWTKLLDLLFEDDLVGRCLLAPDGSILRANSEWLRSTGFTREVVGEDIVALFPEVRDMTLALHARARAGHRIEVPRHAQTVNGRKTWWEGCIDPVPMEGGTGLLITARKVMGAEMGIAREAARSEPRAALLDGDERFRALLDQVGDAFVMHDFEGRLLDVNRCACERLGYTREELLGMRVTDIEQDFDLAAAQREWAKIRPGEPFMLLGHNRRKDGTTFPVEVRFACLDLYGKRLFFGLARDISDRVRAETALRESELLYSFLFTLAPAGVVFLDETGQIYAFNDQAHEALGYTREEFAKLRISDIDADESPEDVRRHVLRIFDAGVSEFDARHRAKSGELRHVRARSRVVHLGGKRCILSVWQDVTDRKQREEALRESESRLRALAEALRESEARLRAALEATPDAVIVSRLRDGVYTAANDGFERLCGWARSEIIGKTGPELNIWVDLEDRRRLLDDLIQHHFVQSAEARFRRKDGSVFTGWVSARTFEADGERYLLAITRDISDLRAAEAALREADRQKDQFLAMLSHELRNPLAPIRNSLYLLDRAAPDGEQARRAKAILHRQVGQLTWLIDDLLDVTRITHGKVQLQRERLDLNELAHRTVEDHRTGFVKGDVRMEVLPAPAEVWVNGDRVRLTQVIGNLLQNAAKFTPHGGKATVSVESDDARGEAVLTVRDTGSGIDPEMLPRVFQAFTQADTTLDRSKGGLGLGLALVKGLVELHGGSVSAASAGPGKGAAFTVRLPLDETVAQVLDRCDAGGAVVRCRVLVIEDNQDAADSLRDVLQLDGHVVEVAYTGREGIEKAHAFRPDVVLCDIGLPGLDGYGVARAMRAAPELGRVALVAVSGYTQPEDVARSKEAGFDAHLAKPPSVEKLTLALEEAGALSQSRAV